MKWMAARDCLYFEMTVKKNLISLFSTDPATLARFDHDSVYQGRPDYACYAHDWQTVQEILAYCHVQNLPITFCGSQTSMTGSSVADEGLALSLTQKNKILDIGTDKNGGHFAVCEPGVILGDLKRAAQKEGFFYPPDPTSYDDALVGATIATNATGEDTLKYGPTRRYVKELEVILPDGATKTLKRKKDIPHTLAKNTAGYYMDAEKIDEVIGSEGTLCLIKKITLTLLRLTKDKTFALILPFSDFQKAIRAVPLIAAREQGPKALELIGPGAVTYFKQCPRCPSDLKNENCFLYLKDEYAEEADLKITLEKWFDALTKIYCQVGDTSCLDRIFLAQTDQQLSDIHTCRHYVPLKVNEEYFKYNASGGGKVGTDWWVPLHHLEAMMMKTFEEAQQLNIPFLVFAHIGNGHPHWNFLTRNTQEKQLAEDFVKRQCKAAVLYGGGVAGEHGIGKIKRSYMNIQHAPKVISRMIKLKQEWDPKWLLGRGNIFDCTRKQAYHDPHHHGHALRPSS